MSLRRILVVGASGRIGRMVRRAWAQNAPDMMQATYQTRTAVSDKATDDRHLLWDPLTDDTAALQATGPFDAMLVLAGVVPKPGADFSLNREIGLACLDAAAACGIPRVLLASTSAVYGATLARAYREDDICEPVNDYGCAKQQMETACLARARDLNLTLCCLRIGNVAGADALLLNGAALQEGVRLPLDQFADGGTPLRSYIGPATLARVLAHLMLHPAPPDRVLNIAAPVPITMGDLAKAAALPFDLRPAPATAHQTVTLDCARLAGLYPFAPADSQPPDMVRQWRELRDI